MSYLNTFSRAFLCGSPSQLLFALADIAQCSEPTEILYINDLHALDPALEKRLALGFPELRLTVANDMNSEAEFSNLPTICPAILRRNLRRDGLRLIAPMHWTQGPLGARRYRTAYTFHTGPFLAKVLAGAADKVILREDGLSNYHLKPMPLFKRVLRQLNGYQTATQVMGDEHWVDLIEVSRPEDLPTALKQKASHFDALGRAARLSTEAKDRIIEVFAPTDSELSDPVASAVLLTQPLDAIGMGSFEQKIILYQKLADILKGAGYSVYVKNHPREKPYVLRETTSLNNKIPAELWTLSGKQPFQIGVALCSAGLMPHSGSFCRKSIQLVDPTKFIAGEFTRWNGAVATRLAKALSQCDA